MSQTAVQPSETVTATLRDLSLQPCYRTEEDDLLAGFLLPCLRAASQFDRSAGYFDTRAFTLAADGLARFFVDGGRMRLLVSPRLRRRDAAALAGRAAWSPTQADAVRDRPVPAEALADWLRRDRLGCTAWLVAEGLLDVRVAFRQPESGVPFSHYHEKIGVFTDAAGNTVAFSGSVNETGLAWRGNFESIDVFRSWRPDERARAAAKAAAFDRLWRDETPGLAVHPIDEAPQLGLGLGLGLDHVWRSVKTAAAARLRRGGTGSS